MGTPPKLINIVCSHCGSDDIACDATARWDVDQQDWIMSSTFDSKTCGACGYEKDYMAEVDITPEAQSIWTYKDKQYQVNSVMTNNLTQDPETGNWRPTVRYTQFPQTGLVFYRADTEWLRKFSPLRE